MRENVWFIEFVFIVFCIMIIYGAEFFYTLYLDYPG